MRLTRVLRVLSVVASSLPLAAAAEDGRVPYLMGCVGCHGEAGVTISQRVPDLKDQIGYFLHLPEGRAYLVRLPNVAFAPISDKELADMMNYMVFTLGGSSAPKDARPYSAAEVGKLRSLHLKLVRRLLLEPPKASGTTVTLTGDVTLPLTKPVAPVIVEQQLECGKTTIAKTFTPPAGGRFDITLTVPANAKAAIYRLTSKVAANKHSVTHGFTTFSLPLPVALG